MMTMSVNVGEMIQIGDNPDAGAVIKVKEKSGRMVKLVLATNLPIEKLSFGLIPPRFVHGITGKPTVARAHVA